MAQLSKRSYAARRGSWQSMLPLWMALGLCTAFGVYRAWDLNARGSEYTRCENCFFIPTLGHDAWLLSALAALLAVGVLVRPGGLRLLARVLAALLLLAMSLDMALAVLLSQRLQLTDLFRFSGDMSNNWSVVSSGLFNRAGLPRLVIAIICIATLIALCRPGYRSRKLGLAFAMIALGWAGFAAVSVGRLNYVHEELLKNVVENNLRTDRMVGYGAPFAAAAETLAQTLPVVCDSKPAQKPNVIFLLVESLSSYQSKLLGGPQDWTPQLDQLALDNHYLTRFHANGFTTSGGEIALMTGLPPVYSPGSLDNSFAHFNPEGQNLADVAHRNGYSAGFFTSADTGFLSIGAWLRDLGFDTVDGQEAAFYQGMKRYAFGAVEDQAFLDRYLQWLDQGGSGESGNISVLMTVTGHPPFVDPATGAPNEEQTFRYIDAQVVRFQRELAKRGFFDDGMLVILGDHRAMTPLRPGELRTFGERAFSRVPLIVVGNVDMPKVIDAPFQQTDLLPSLRDLLGERVCTHPFQGLLFRAEPIPPRYVVHVRGDNRNRIDVYSSSGELWGYHTNGDASRWMGDAPADADQIAAWITARRVEAQRTAE